MSTKNVTFGIHNVREIPNFLQAEFDTTYQLRLLMAVANRLGLYDAADIIQDILDKRN